MTINKKGEGVGASVSDGKDLQDRSRNTLSVMDDLIAMLSRRFKVEKRITGFRHVHASTADARLEITIPPDKIFRADYPEFLIYGYCDGYAEHVSIIQDRVALTDFPYRPNKRKVGNDSDQVFSAQHGWNSQTGCVEMSHVIKSAAEYVDDLYSLANDSKLFTFLFVKAYALGLALSDDPVTYMFSCIRENLDESECYENYLELRSEDMIRSWRFYQRDKKNDVNLTHEQIQEYYNLFK